jgi:hypothetical protein
VNQDGDCLKSRCSIDNHTRPRVPVKRRNAGTVLRYWTADTLAFMGKGTTTATGAADWGVAAGRKLRILATRLESLRGERAG